MTIEPPRNLLEALARIEVLEAGLSRLRHDVRGMLAPALLMADLIRDSSDPRVAKAGTVIANGIERVDKRLRESRDLVPPRGPSADILPSAVVPGAATSPTVAETQPSSKPARPLVRRAQEKTGTSWP
jgi:hypothetical protein